MSVGVPQRTGNLWQKVMLIVSGIGLAVAVIGAVVCFLPIPGARIVGIKMAAVGLLVAGIAAFLGGFGEFDS